MTSNWRGLVNAVGLSSTLMFNTFTAAMVDDASTVRRRTWPNDALPHQWVYCQHAGPTPGAQVAALVNCNRSRRSGACVCLEAKWPAAAPLTPQNATRNRVCNSEMRECEAL